MELDLVCLGNVTIDDVVLPDGRTQMACFGGDTIYATFSAEYWNERVQPVTPVGNDFPEEHWEKFQQRGWNLAGFPKRNVPTTRNWIVYEYDGRRTWIIRSDPDDFYELSPISVDVPPSFLSAKAFLILAMDLKAQEELAPFLKSQGAIVALDPQEDNIVGNQAIVFEMLKSIDIFLPSQEEVHRLLGHRDYERAAREFSEYGSRVVVIKLGSEGALIYDKDLQRYWHIPVYPTTVVDTTGAGDSFSGGFMAMYVKSRDLLKSGLAGAVSASFAIEDFGHTHMLKITPSMAEKRFSELNNAFLSSNS
jgi:sugar/nucleoside kinase (ribokinase family)